MNQPPPLVDYNVFLTDLPLRETLEALPPAARDELAEIGMLSGSDRVQQWARQANENPPQLCTHDRYGNRIDEVEYHPAYHELMRVATRYGLHGAAWRGQDAFAHTLRAAKFYVWSQAEAGHGCPISMTYAAVPVIRAQAQLAADWEPALTARAYDPELAPVADKVSALCGMAMTEKQGGSDVRANVSRATFVQRTAQGDAYALRGHKWFCSAPMSDAFLVLAQTAEGLTCFLMPRVRPDGSLNGIFIQRLKNKLGNRSNASSEIELEDAYALLAGEPGRGIQTILEMVNFTRLDCINGSAAVMRQALAQAVHHCSHRSAFGKLLVQQPLMQNVLADLALESEAAMTLLFRLTAAVDRNEAEIQRLGTAVGKYYVCKRAAPVVAEALECLGGNGYVEDSGMPRLYRESPLNSIWEGSGNINALDVLRILNKQPQTLAAFRAEIEPALGDSRMAAAAADLFASLQSDAGEAQARTLVERMALLWQAALLAARPERESADVFLSSRIAGRWGRTLGTLPASATHAKIVERALCAESVEYTPKV